MKHYHCKLVLAVIIVLGVVSMPLIYVEVKNYIACMQLGESIGARTQYMIGNSCLVRSDDKWVPPATFRKPE